MTLHLVSDGAVGLAEARPGDGFVSVCAMISAHVTARPDAPAVSDAHGRVNFAELDRRSGRLADRLRERGVGPGSCVAVFLERSVEFVVAAHAVLVGSTGLLAEWSQHLDDRLAAALAAAQH